MIANAPSVLFFAVAALATLAGGSYSHAKEKRGCVHPDGSAVVHGTYKNGMMCDNGDLMPLAEWGDMQLFKEEGKIKNPDFFKDLESLCAKVTCTLVRP